MYLQIYNNYVEAKETFQKHWIRNVKTKVLSNYTGKCITTAATSAAATTNTTTTTTTTNTIITGNDDNNFRNYNLMTHTMRNHIF